MINALIAGVMLGAFVAAQVGPVSLLCIRTATRSGFGPAAAIGAGAATVDVAYAGLGVLGAAALLQLKPVGLALGLAGAGVLAWMGVRTLRDACGSGLGERLRWRCSAQPRPTGRDWRRRPPIR